MAAPFSTNITILSCAVYMSNPLPVVGVMDDILVFAYTCICKGCGSSVLWTPTNATPYKENNLISIRSYGCRRCKPGTTVLSGNTLLPTDSFKE